MTNPAVVDVEYLKDPPRGGNRYVGSEFSREQMIAAGLEIEDLRQQIDKLQDEITHRDYMRSMSL